MSHLGYKVWNIIFKKWVNLNNADYGLDPWGNLCKYYTNCGELDSLVITNEVLVRCTGKRDSEGTLVYDKDVIGGTHSLGLVFWCEEKCGFYVQSESGTIYNLGEFEFDVVLGSSLERPKMFQLKDE